MERAIEAGQPQQASSGAQRKRRAAQPSSGMTVRVAVVGLLACLHAAPSLAQATPDALVARAVTFAGGASALTQARVFTWDARAVVHAGGRDIAIAGTWQVCPPDSSIVTTYEQSKGPSSTRRAILAGAQGWLTRDTARTPMPPEVLAEERHQFYLYALLRVLPLRDPGVRLTSIAPDSSGLQGLRVESPGRLPVDVYFAADGRVARLRTAFAMPGGASGDAQDVILTGTTEASGVRWFRRMEIRRAGQPYFDLEITALTVAPRAPGGE